MKKVLVLGAGRVGKSVAEMLLSCGRGAYRVNIADHDEAHLKAAEANLARLKDRISAGASGGGFPVEYAAAKIDVTNGAALRGALAGHDYVVCMLPFNLVSGIAEAANDLGVHYFDATEDVETTERVRAIDAAGRARVALAPQCGLAPGYIAIAAHDIAREFSAIHDLTLRVGALPQFPTNRLKYNITWSAAGVVNEYCEPCRVMLGGRMVSVPALEGLERFSFEGVEYEAFYTSGGVGTLIDTLTEQGKTGAETNIAYKTLRYPGHCTLMKVLLQDLRLGVEHAPSSPSATPSGTGRVFDRSLAVELLEHALPRTEQDVVVIFINCVGVRNGVREQVNFRRAVRATELFGRVWPAIELTTAAGVCAMVDLHRLGKLKQTGFVRQEEVGLGAFNETLFGLAYEAPERLEDAILARLPREAPAGLPRLTA